MRHRPEDAMPDLTLVIGNRNYSSWSLRPWILLQHLGIDCAIVRLPLDTPEFAREIGRWSSSGKVPVLVHGDLRVYESIAIAEYANELSGGRAWPQDPARRALARSAAAEMHGGFQALRGAYPMNLRARKRRVAMTPELAASIARVDALWSGHRARFGTDGPWLFGEYSAADAMFAPVALRFRTYGDAGLGDASRAYAATLVADPLLQPWIAAAEAETEIIGADEAGEE
jgi:glutathione S-transferase